MVNLREIVTEEMLIECLELEVSDEQEGLVNTNAESLALAWFNRENTRPFCIYAGDEMVGFVMLLNDEPDKSCEIWQFMIDEKYQGKGYGKAAVKAIIEYVKGYPVFETINLGAFPDNDAAIKFYENCGFTLTGEVLDDGDEVVLELVL